MDLFKLFGIIGIKNSEANDAIDDTTEKAKGAESKMVSAFKKIGAAVVTYFAVDKVIDFGKQVVNAAAEVSAEASAFEQIMGKYSDQAAEKVNAIADATGMVSTRLTPYMTSMTAKFKGLGYDIDDATSLASDGLNLAADAAAFWDKSLDDSMSALNSFINGSYEGGEAIGLFANDTQMASYAVKQGIVSESKEWANLDEARKQATRLEYAQAMFEASGAVGQAAKESGQYANVQANLTEKWRQFKAQIGEPLLQNVVLPAMEKLSGLVDVASEKFEGLQTWISQNKEQFDKLTSKVKEITDYAVNSFQPAFESVREVFEKIKNALQPLIDNIKEYFNSGQAAKDTTDLLKGAIDLVSSAIEGLANLIDSIIEGFKNMKSWVEQNTPLLTALAGVFGILTAAIVAYNVAEAIKNAGGIAEIAQLAILQIQLWALTAAETAHSIASGIAAVATTAFGAALNFLMSPVTLVVLAIGALIAIVVLLVKNWDKVKEGAIAVWNKIVEVFSQIASWLMENVIQPVLDFFTGLWEGIKNGVNTAIEAIKGFFVDLWNKIVEVFTAIATWIYEHIIQPIANFYETWIAPVVNKIIEIVTKLVEIVVGLFVGLRNLLVEKVIIPIGDFFWGLWDTVSGFFVNLWNDIVNLFIGLATWFDTNVIQPVVNFFKGVWDTVSGFFTNLWNDITSVFWEAAVWFELNVTRPIKDFFKDIWDKIKNFASDAWQGIKNTFSNVGDFFKGVFQKAYNAVTSIFEKIGNFFSGIWDKIKNTFSKLGTTIGDAIGGAVKSGINKVIDFIEGTINKAIGLINGAIDLINKLPGVNVGKIQELSMPRLAKGGVLEKGQVGVLEGSGAEAVVPLEKNKKWLSRVANDLNDIQSDDGRIAADDRVYTMLETIIMLLEKLTGMKIYLDKDILVGELAPEMDTQFGSINKLRLRGN